MRSLLYIAICVFSLNSHCQNICNVPKEDNLAILSAVFDNDEVFPNDTINIRNNFNTSCVRFEKINSKKIININSEKSLYDSLIDDYYYISNFYFSKGLAQLNLIQRKENMLATITLVKTRDKSWKIIDVEKVNGLLKVDDFLYGEIRKMMNQQGQKEGAIRDD